MAAPYSQSSWGYGNYSGGGGYGSAGYNSGGYSSGGYGGSGGCRGKGGSRRSRSRARYGVGSRSPSRGRKRSSDGGYGYGSGRAPDGCDSSHQSSAGRGGGYGYGGAGSSRSAQQYCDVDGYGGCASRAVPLHGRSSGQPVGHNREDRGYRSRVVGDYPQQNSDYPQQNRAAGANRHHCSASCSEEYSFDDDDDDELHLHDDDYRRKLPLPPGSSAPPLKPPLGLPLEVSGCRNKTISNIIAGMYMPYTTNHGRVVYKKEKEERSRGLHVLIYYWDDRDGPDLCGWWFGPNVGGDQVWAYHPSRGATTPPTCEWNVPHDGPIDPTFSVCASRSVVGAAMSSTGAGSCVAAGTGESGPPQKHARLAPGGMLSSAAALAAASAAAPPSTSRATASRAVTDTGGGSSRNEYPTSSRRQEADDSRDGHVSAEVPPHQRGTGRRQQQPARHHEQPRHQQQPRRRDQHEPQQPALKDIEDVRARPHHEERESARPHHEEREPARPHHEERESAEELIRQEMARAREHQRRRLQERAREEEEEQRALAAAREKEEEQRSKRGEQVLQREPLRDSQRSLEHDHGNRHSGKTAGAPRGDDRGERGSWGTDHSTSDRGTDRAALGKGGADGFGGPERGKPGMDRSPMDMGGSYQRGAPDRGTGRSALDRGGAGERGTSDRGPDRPVLDRGVTGERGITDRGADRSALDRGGAAERRAPDRGADRSALDRGRAGERGASDRGTDRSGGGAGERGASDRGTSDRGTDRSALDRGGASERGAGRGTDRSDRGGASERGSDRGGAGRPDRAREHDDRNDRRKRRSPFTSRYSPPPRRGHRSRSGSRERRRLRGEGRGRGARRNSRARSASPKRREERNDNRRGREEDRTSNEDRKRREEEEDQRRREEKKRREEEDRERAKQEEERRKQEQERRKLEEEKRKEENEQKRREEWKRHEEQVKQKAEEERKRQEQEAKRREEEALVLKQQQSTLAVLRVLQKLSNANPQNFDALTQELEDIMKTELPQTGSQRDILQAEADRVLEYAKQYVEQAREQQVKWEEMRLEQQQRQEEQENKVRGLLSELGELVTVAEAASDNAHYTAAPLAGEHDLDTPEVLRIGKAVEDAGRTAMSACSACADFLVQNRPVIDEAESILSESTATISTMQPRIQAATRQATEALQRAKENKDRIGGKMALTTYQDKQATIFSKYDKNGDGVLNRNEIAGYSEEEFGFVLPQINLDRIWSLLVQDGCDGIEFNEFQLLKTSVGIALDEEIGRKKRVLRLEREEREREEAVKRHAMLGDTQKLLTQRCEELMAEVSGLDPLVQAAEMDAEMLASEANQLSIDDLSEKASRVEASVEAVKTMLKDIQTRIASLMNHVAEWPELVEPMRTELTSLGSKSEVSGMRLKKAQGMATNARHLAWHKEFTAFETMRLEVAANLRGCIEARGGKIDDLFAVIAGGADANEVTRSQIYAFLNECQCEIGQEKLDTVLTGCAEANMGEAMAVEDRQELADVDGTTASAATAAIEAPAAVATATAAEAAEAGTEAETKAETGAEAGADPAPVVTDEGKSAPAVGSDGSKAEDGNTKEAPVNSEQSSAGAQPSTEGTTQPAEESAAEVNDSAAAPVAIVDATNKEENVHAVEQSGEGGGENNNHTTEQSISVVAEPNNHAVQQSIIARNSQVVLKSDFMRVVRIYYKVVKEIVLSDNLLIEQSGQIRRMEIGEVMEVFQGPMLDASVGVYRIHGCALKDGTCGWVTVVGNQGITFLMPGGSVFAVLNSTPLNHDLKDLDSERCIRMLQEGEVIEVLEWARTSRSALGVTRVRARIRGERSVSGWATIADNMGGVFLQAL